jgi:hypothetical protein
MSLPKISHPKPIGFYLNSPIPSELESLGQGGSLSLYSALILCEVAASAAAMAWQRLQEDGSGQYYFGTSLINLYPTETPDFPETDILWRLSFDCQGWLEFLAWCQDLASCRLRDSQAQ